MRPVADVARVQILKRFLCRVQKHNIARREHLALLKVCAVAGAQPEQILVPDLQFKRLLAVLTIELLSENQGRPLMLLLNEDVLALGDDLLPRDALLV